MSVIERRDPRGLPVDGTRPVVAAADGTVRGTRTGDIRVFRGIPYAQPPVGELRFRAPRPVQAWQGVLDASRFGPIAPQPNVEISGAQPPRTSEDCLSLNVYTPALGSARLPVMVWIHGGAYYVGSSADPMYDGAALASRGVVVVTMNYRLGALGYLDFSTFATSDEPFDSNLGHRDQLAALRWVRENIAAFGGDPDAVTVFGESAGAGAVTTLLATPSAAGLFRGAIAQSSPVGSVYSIDTARGFAAQFLDALHLDARDIGRLRTIDVRVITDACASLVETNPRSAPGTIPVAPVVDGDLIPEYPLSAFQTGSALRVPVVIGTDRDESELFRLMRSPILPTTTHSIDLMVDNLGTEQAKGIPSAYPGYPSRRAALRVSTDAAFRMPTLWAAAGHSAYAPTWVYRYDYVPPLLRMVGLGAMHGSELPTVWGNRLRVRVPFGGMRTWSALSDRMQRRWVHFATALDPNPPGLAPAWHQYDAVQRRTIVFDSVDREARDLDGDTRRAWGDEVIAFR